MTHDDKLMTDLETLLDRSDIQRVVATLATICTEKSEHVRGNWADNAIARAWEHNARLLGRASIELRKTF